MKKIFPAVLLGLLSTSAMAQSDFAVTLTITGGITAGGTTYNVVQLDLNVGSRYLTANGALMSGQLSAPATGTCFFTNVGGVYCNLQVDQDSLNIELSSSLSGTITAENSSGITYATAPVAVTGVE